MNSIKQQLEQKVRHMIKQVKFYECPINECKYTNDNKLSMIDHVISGHYIKDVLLEEKE